MGMASPKKKRMAFGLVGLLIAVALASVLWRFQDIWLPYWFPTDTDTEQPVSLPPKPTPAAPAGAAVTAPGVPTTAERLAVSLDFLSAAVWSDARFTQGVRMFNQALDRYRTFQHDHRPAELLQQAEDGALQAAVTFNQLQPEAPAEVPLADYIARCQNLATEARNLRVPAAARAAAVPAPAPVAAPPRTTTPPPKPGEAWQDPDYLQGAQLFNQALAQYKAFLADKSHLEMLKPIEETAFQAAKKFEAIQSQAPANVPVSDHISQCYRLIADCRRQNLESGNLEDAATPNRARVVGPSRRPALPAYQPPPAQTPAANPAP